MGRGAVEHVVVSEKQKILLETTEARAKAESLLRGLLEARTTSEQRLNQLRQPDMLKSVTGTSSMDNAIKSTQRIIAALDRTLEEFRKDLTDEDLAVLNDLRA